jgi:hypothetical protein
MPIIETTHEIKARIQRDAAGSSLTAEHIYLLVAVAAGIIAVAVYWNGPHGWVADGIFDLLRIVAAIAGCGYLIRSAETRVKRMLTNQAVSAERARREGYAAGFLDGAARKVPEPAQHLRSVN